MAEQSSADFRGALGRYALYGEIAAGGMATVHLARLLGPVGFARTVAIKRLHPHLAKDPDFVAMFLEEARLAARVRHTNVVQTLDVVSDEAELFLVMEYVAGESLARIVRKARDAGDRMPPRHVVGILSGALEGLHAAHEAKSEKGAQLGLVHRDVSPQNIHVGLDGVPRVLDFGIAKATNRVQETRTDQIKGKIAYMSPEQLAKGPIDRRADVYSASVVLWEALTGQRLFKAEDVPSLVYAIINDEVVPPSQIVEDLPPALDEVVMRGLDREAANRWTSAREMAAALEKALTPAPSREIGAFIQSVAGEALEWRQELVHRIESETSNSIPPMRIDSPGMPIEVASGVVPTDSVPDGFGDALMYAPPDPDETATLLDGGDPASEAADARKRRGRLIVAVAAAALLSAFALMGARWSRHLEPEAPPDEQATAVPPETAEAESAISIAAKRTPTAPGAPATASASASPSASASAGPSASASASTSAPTSPPSRPAYTPPQRPKVTTPTPPARNDDCDNPFTVDARGIRHPKPHCFKR